MLHCNHVVHPVVLVCISCALGCLASARPTEHGSNSDSNTPDYNSLVKIEQAILDPENQPSGTDHNGQQCSRESKALHVWQGLLSCINCSCLN